MKHHFRTMEPTRIQRRLLHWFAERMRRRFHKMGSISIAIDIPMQTFSVVLELVRTRWGPLQHAGTNLYPILKHVEQVAIEQNADYVELRAEAWLHLHIASALVANFDAIEDELYTCSRSRWIDASVGIETVLRQISTALNERLPLECEALETLASSFAYTLGSKAA